MPVVFIEAPPGIRTDAKKKMVERITSAIDDAYHIGDTLIFLREYRLTTWRWMAAFSRKIQRSWRSSRRSVLDANPAGVTRIPSCQSPER